MVKEKIKFSLKFFRAAFTDSTALWYSSAVKLPGKKTVKIWERLRAAPPCPSTMHPPAGGMSSKIFPCPAIRKKQPAVSSHFSGPAYYNLYF